MVSLKMAGTLFCRSTIREESTSIGRGFCWVAFSSSYLKFRRTTVRESVSVYQTYSILEYVLKRSNFELETHFSASSKPVAVTKYSLQSDEQARAEI